MKTRKNFRTEKRKKKLNTSTISVESAKQIYRFIRIATEETQDKIRSTPQAGGRLAYCMEIGAFIPLRRAQDLIREITKQGKIQEDEYYDLISEYEPVSPDTEEAVISFQRAVFKKPLDVRFQLEREVFIKITSCDMHLLNESENLKFDINETRSAQYGADSVRAIVLGRKALSDARRRKLEEA